MFLNKFSCLAVLSFCLIACSPGEEVARLELTDKAARVYVEHIARDTDVWSADYNWRMSEDGSQHILYVERYPTESDLEDFAKRLQRNLDATPVAQPSKVVYRVDPVDESQAERVKNSGGDINQDIPLAVSWGEAEVSVYGPAIDLSAYGFGGMLDRPLLTCTYRFPVAQDIPELSYRRQITTGDNGEKLAQMPALAESIAKLNAAMPAETIQHTVTVTPGDLQPVFDGLQLQYAQHDGLFWVSPTGIRQSSIRTPFANNSYIADCETDVMENAPVELLILGGSMPLVGRINGFSISKPKAPR